MKFKEHSHIPVEKIKEMQEKYRVELLQPRLPDGKLNHEFLQHYGAKNIRISLEDITQMEKTDMNYANKLRAIFKTQATEEKWQLQ